jgi:hypothetical protein
MRSLLVIALLALTGCASSPPPLPVQPDAPTSKAVVTTLGADLDKTDHRVASALVAIERNADKPKVVVAESRLAQSYLPSPPEGDVAFAMASATKADPIDYKKQMEFGRKLATAVSLAWDKLEANQAEAARVSQLKDARIVELTKAVDQAKKDAAANLWTLAGIAVAVLGAAAMVFTGPRIGGTLLASGAAIGAFPFIVESEYFTYIAGGTLALAAGLGIYWLWDRVRDSANAPYEPPQK